MRHSRPRPQPRTHSAGTHRRVASDCREPSAAIKAAREHWASLYEGDHEGDKSPHGRRMHRGAGLAGRLERWADCAAVRGRATECMQAWLSRSTGEGASWVPPRPSPCRATPLCAPRLARVAARRPRCASTRARRDCGQPRGLAGRQAGWQAAQCDRKHGGSQHARQMAMHLRSPYLLPTGRVRPRRQSPRPQRPAGRGVRPSRVARRMGRGCGGARHGQSGGEGNTHRGYGRRPHGRAGPARVPARDAAPARSPTAIQWVLPMCR